ncbi:MAG: hypothetical protein ACOCUN_00340 [Jiangellaceae bacterium]
MTTPVPDPDTPELRAIDIDGQLLNGGVFWLPHLEHGETPTAADMARAEHLGWVKRVETVQTRGDLL